MESLIYLLDANTISDLLVRRQAVRDRFEQAFETGHTICLCEPVYYELLRGLIKVSATTRLHLLEETIIPMLRWEVVSRADWVQGARYWAEATKRGRQFSDIDLLIAAIATRLNAVIVSSDADFDALPVKRENWRESFIS